MTGCPRCGGTLGARATLCKDCELLYDRWIRQHAGVDRMVRQLASAAGTRLVVVTAEPTSLTDAYAFIKVTITDDPTADLRIVVNQAKSQAEGERTYNTTSSAWGGVFAKMTPQQVDAIASRVFGELRAATSQ